MKQSVIAIIFDTQGHVLLIKRRDVPVWVLPGGGIDEGETPEQAVCREALEETGLVVDIKRKVAEYTPINRLANLTHVFECRALGGNLLTGSETKDLGYFPIDRVPSTLFVVHQAWLVDALKNDSGLIRSPITQVTYWKLFLHFLRHPIHVLRFALSRLGLPINS